MKKLLSVFLSLALLLALAVPSLADDYFYYVFDDADMLTDDEEWELEEYAASISEEYDCGVYFISVDDFHDLGESDAYDAAKYLYRNMELGLGEDESGVLLMMSLSNRKMALIAHGYGNAAITDRINEDIRDTIKKSFRNDDWYSGVLDYFQETGRAIADARENGITEADTVVYVQAPLGWRLVAILILFLLAMLVALVVTQVMKSQLKSVAPKTQAMDYSDSSPLELRVRQDRYLHTTTTRQYSPQKSDNNSSGGGSTSVDSGGFSGSSDDF